MKCLLVSDSHGFKDVEEFIKFKNIDYSFHLGDSELDSSALDCYDCKIKGNCDTNDLDDRCIVRLDSKNIYVTHGHLENIHYSTKAFDNAKKEECSIIFHGHTHVVKTEICEGILVINPGSIFSSRCDYPETFMIVEFSNDNRLDVKINIYDAKSFELIEQRKVHDEEITTYSS